MSVDTLRPSGLPTGLRDLTLAVVAQTVGRPVEELEPDRDLVAQGVGSLAIGEICARLGEALGRPVAISTVFGAGTVDRLVARLAEHPCDAPPVTTTPDGTAPDGTAPDEATVPLSPTQAFMFMKHVFAPDDLSLHCVRTWRVTGRPDRAALRAAVDTLHRRHGYLSATYGFSSTPYARPGTAPLPVPVELLADTEEQARAALDDALRRPFRLVEGQVWRLVYVGVRNDHVTLLGLAAHHVAFDGGSAGVLAADLGAAYDAAVAHREPYLPPTPTPARSAAAADAHLPHVDLPAQRAHWHRALAGLTELDLPAGDPAAPARPAMLDLELPAATHRRARVAAARLGVSPFAVYLTAFGEALAGVTGSADVTVATPVNRRGHHELRRATGCLINILPLRLRPDPSTEVTRAVGETAVVVAAAFAAQDVPVPQIAELVRDAGGPDTLFRTMFVLQDNDPGTLALGDLDVRFFRPAYPGVSTDVYAEVWPDGDAARLVLATDPRRVGAGLAPALAAAFADRLGRIVEDTR